MATRQPGVSTSFPSGQARQQFGRDWGNYASAATLPNAAGNVLPANQFTLEAGDRAYLIVSGTSGIEYLCVSAGTAGGGNAVWIVNSGGLGPWSSVLYVDNVRGSDATGTRGDNNLPFATPQAAINAMQTADVVQLAPQLFLLTATLTVPATVVRGGIVGATPQTNIIASTAMPGTVLQVNAPATAAFDFGVNLGLTFFEIAQLAVRASGLTAIRALGTAYAAGTFLSNGLLLRRVQLAATTAIDAKYAGGVLAQYSLFNGVISLVGCGFNALYGCGSTVGNPGGPNITNTYDATDPLSVPGAGSGQLTVMAASFVGLVTLGVSASIVLDTTSFGAGIKGNPAAPLAVTGGFVPNVTWAGGLGASNIDFFSAGSELPDTASVCIVHFKGAKGYSVPFLAGNGVQSLASARFKIAGAAANPQTINLDSTTFVTGVVVTASANCVLTGRGGSWPNAVLSTPDATGSILPPQFTTGPTALASIAQAITFGFRMPGSTYMVAPDLDDSTAVYQSVSPRTATGFTVNVAIAAGNFRGLVTYMG